MRLTKEQAAENRRLILAAGSRLFRERGFDGVGVADVMAEAGFTHGGFYNHFQSKEALMEESSDAEIERFTTAAAASFAEAGPEAWGAVAAEYVSRKHRDKPETGCTIAALATDAARQGPEVQAPFAKGIERMIGVLATATGEPTESAMRLWSELVGAIVLSRAVRKSDPALAERILEATRSALPQPTKNKPARLRRRSPR